MNTKITRPLRRAAFTMLTLLLLLSISTTIVFAGNVHFLKKGPPTFSKTPTALQLTADGTVYGLGNGDVLVTLDATGTANTLCTNPGGSSKVPGQNPNFSASGSASVPAANVINGHASFSVTTNPPASPVPGAPDTIKIYQPCSGPTPAGCTLVLNQMFSGPPFPL